LGTCWALEGKKGRAGPPIHRGERNFVASRMERGKKDGGKKRGKGKKKKKPPDLPCGSSPIQLREGKEREGEGKRAEAAGYLLRKIDDGRRRERRKKEGGRMLCPLVNIFLWKKPRSD